MTHTQTVKFRDAIVQSAWDKQANDIDVIESGIDQNGLLYTQYANGVITRCTRKQFIAETRRLREQATDEGYKFTQSGEKVFVTDKTRNLGHGEQVKVKYCDGSTGWEHIEDLLD